MAARFGVTSDKVGIGVGIHSGQVEIGEFSTVRSDFTAIGGTVNTAARLESQAAAGEILVSSESAALAPSLITKPTRSLALKGIEHPVLAQFSWLGTEGRVLHRARGLLQADGPCSWHFRFTHS